MVTLPATFSVTLMVPTDRLPLPRMFRLAGRWGRVTGTLRISEGAVEAETWRMAKRIVGGALPITQRQSPVVVVRCRGLPRSLQTSMIVADGDAAILAVLRPFSERRLRDALEASGFTIEEVAASFNLGTRELLRRFPSHTH